jgi:hypothetical protein
MAIGIICKCGFRNKLLDLHLSGGGNVVCLKCKQHVVVSKWKPFLDGNLERHNQKWIRLLQKM